MILGWVKARAASFQLCLNAVANSSWGSHPCDWIWINSSLCNVGGRLIYPPALRVWGCFCDSLNIHNFGQRGSHPSYTVVTGFKPSWKHCTDVHPFSFAHHVVLAEGIKHLVGCIKGGRITERETESMMKKGMNNREKINKQRSRQRQRQDLTLTRE